MFSLDIVFWKTKFMNWLGDVKYRLFGRDVSSLRKQNFEQEVERTIQEFAQENLSFQSKAIFEGWRVALSLSLKLIIVWGGLEDTSWTQSLSMQGQYVLMPYKWRKKYWPCASDKYLYVTR